MSDEISLEGVDRVEAFRRLYNASQPQGMGYLAYDPEPMDYETAKAEFGRGSFDYHRGRVMKVRLDRDVLHTHLYDRDNGDGAARAALGDLITDDAVA